MHLFNNPDIFSFRRHLSALCWLERLRMWFWRVAFYYSKGRLNMDENGIIFYLLDDDNNILYSSHSCIYLIYGYLNMMNSIPSVFKYVPETSDELPSVDLVLNDFNTAYKDVTLQAKQFATLTLGQDNYKIILYNYNDTGG